MNLSSYNTKRRYNQNFNSNNPQGELYDATVPGF